MSDNIKETTDKSGDSCYADACTDAEFQAYVSAWRRWCELDAAEKQKQEANK